MPVSLEENMMFLLSQILEMQHIKSKLETGFVLIPRKDWFSESIESVKFLFPVRKILQHISVLVS